MSPPLPKTEFSRLLRLYAAEARLVSSTTDDSHLDFAVELLAEFGPILDKLAEKYDADPRYTPSTLLGALEIFNNIIMMAGVTSCYLDSAVWPMVFSSVAQRTQGFFNSMSAQRIHDMTAMTTEAVGRLN